MPGKSLPMALNVNDPVGDGGWITSRRSHRQSKPVFTVVEAAELRRRAVGFDLELLDRIDGREERHLAGLGLEDGDAVEQVFVGARAFDRAS